MASSAPVARFPDREFRATPVAAHRWWWPQALLVLAAVAGSLLVYLPFLGRMSTVYRFWDGPSYLTIAANLYEVTPGNPLAPDVNRPPYYLSHLPLYPFLVRGLSAIGYQRALLAASILATIAAVLLFYRLARDVWKLPSPGFLSLVFLFLPPNWLLYRSVGASEPLYIALVLASIWHFEKSQYGRASLAAGLAALTRHSGIMILPAYAVILLMRQRQRSLAWLAIIPSGLIAYVVFCAMKFGDPWASVERNLELIASPVPFASLLRIDSWPVHHHAEFYILLTLLYVVGILRLRRFPVLLTYCAFQFLFYSILSTRDFSRYYLAIAPFALIVGFRDILNSRAFRWTFPVLVLMAIYWARHSIPLNVCFPEVYAQLLAHLGLAGEGVP